MSARAADSRDPWLAIELRHLAALQAIESEGTFTEAALSLGYVQSAVSGQVATLERLTGTRLVERSRRRGPQRLTMAGTLLLAHWRDMLVELEAASRRVTAEDKEQVTDLRLGLAAALPDGHIGPVLASAVSKSFGLTLSAVETLEGAALAEAITTREVDIALTDLPLTHEGIATAEIAHRPVELVVQACSPLARRAERPTLRELCRLPLVVWREGRDPSRIELELSERGLTPHVVARADGSAAVASLVRAGLGMAMLPRDSVPSDGTLATMALGDQLPERSIGVAWLRARSADPALRRFISLTCRLREDP
jgi:DNA-binding transcriptional LysR family regulator